jgi:hypothetical protein
MNHLTEEQLILHYYGEEGDPATGGESLAAEQHLEGCGECRRLYSSLVRVLNVVDSFPVPDRCEAYGAQVWSRIEQRIPRKRRWFQFGGAPLRWAVASAACAALMIAAFVAGRFYPLMQQQGRAGRIITAKNIDPQGSERVLLVAVGDYLERSQMVLVELANTNAKGTIDISAEQERAEDLVSETRLYRQTAARTGDTNIDNVLEELERVLVDITHEPSKISPQGLESLRQRLQSEGILFKIRVLGSNVRNQDVPAAQTAGQKL